MLDNLKKHPQYKEALQMANNMSPEQKQALMNTPIAKNIMKSLNLDPSKVTGGKLSKKRKSRRRTKKGGKLSKKRKSKRRSKRR